MKKQREKGAKRARVGQSKQIAQLAKPAKRPETRASAPRRAATKARAKQPRKHREYTTNPDSQYLTKAEIDAIFAVIKTPRDRAIFRLAYHRGLRAHEPGLLQLSDWNERDGLLFIRRGKNSISRDYRLTAIERTALRAWLKARGLAPGPLFPHGRNAGAASASIATASTSLSASTAAPPASGRKRATCTRSNIPAERIYPSAASPRSDSGFPGTSRRELDADLHALLAAPAG